MEGFILFGVKPARAATRWLDQAPPLAGKPVGVFVTYAVHPRGSLGVLRRGVEARGGKVVAEHASRRGTLKLARPTSPAASWPPAEPTVAMFARPVQ